ncbi:hypothetical protein DM02DRAFT_604978, partial [Periconia macrospinosa]
MPRGRPKKYLTAEARAEAKRRWNHEEYLRRKNPPIQQTTRPDFIHYQPALPGVPTITGPDLGLRISADIPVPRDPLVQADELLEDEDAYRPPSPLAPPAEGDVEAIVERPAETDSEPIHTTAGQIYTTENRDVQPSSMTPVTEEMSTREEAAIANTRSASHASTPPLARDANASAAIPSSPKTPSQRSASVARSSTRSGRFRDFLAQSNTLLSWLGSASRQPSEDRNTPQPPKPSPSQKAISIASTRSTPHLPQPPNGDGAPPAPAALRSPSVRPSNVPGRDATPAASPAQSTPQASSPPVSPAERTAYKLAKQLRHFQGCTHEEHAMADRVHREHHQRPDVHSICSSFEEVTRLLRGVLNGGTPLPDVLSDRGLMKAAALPEGLDLKAAFEGTSPAAQYEHSTYLSKQDQQLWLDAVLLPAIRKTVDDSTLASYLPASEDIASRGTTAASVEASKRKESAREQLLEYRLQHQYLDRLWTTILERIAENPGLDRFHNATLFAHAKNTKPAHMADDLTIAYGHWKEVWAEIAHPQFYSRDRTFVDIAKTITSEDYAYLYDSVPDEFEAETYLWKRCCLESYARTRVKLLEGGKRARGSPLVATYPWATTRDSMGLTLSTMPRGQENMDGLVYSQFYANIKTPFDDSKVYVFDNEAAENLALDPGYIRSLQQQGGGATFSENVCKGSYLHSKGRAFSNLRDNQRQPYGIREEHRVSLTMMDEICEQWHEWDLYDDSIDDARPPLPYYIVPSQELFGFLRAQINKYCFLFEHTLAHTARTYSLPETMVMVIALRALRFCYSSNMLARESLLYKDRWEQRRGLGLVVKEGLGMRETVERCGLGWFLPKFSWPTRRLAQPHGDNMLVGNLLMHAEYKRRWRAVKDLRDVFVRFNQATGWFQQHSVRQDPRLLPKWLEYLHALNLEQFDADVWSSMLAAHKSRPELSPAALRQDGNITFCYKGMKRMFLEEGRASRWLDEFFYLVRLTHWILPYPSSKALIASTKRSSCTQSSTGRMMWFSAVFADPGMVALPFKETPRTVFNLIYRAHRRSRRAGAYNQAWETTALIKACRSQGLLMLGWDRTEEHWIAGRTSAGTKGFLPAWERGMPPTLSMRERIRGLSLDELDRLMVAFTQEQGAVIRGGETREGAAPAAIATPLERLTSIAQVSEQAREERSESGSVFVPSIYSN